MVGLEPKDWRNEAAYDYCRNLLPGGWAWEFLRRSDRYRAAHAEWLRVSSPGQPDANTAAFLARMRRVTALELRCEREFRIYVYRDPAKDATVCSPWWLIDPWPIKGQCEFPPGPDGTWPGYPDSMGIAFSFAEPIEAQIEIATRLLRECAARLAPTSEPPAPVVPSEADRQSLIESINKQRERAALRLTEQRARLAAEEATPSASGESLENLRAMVAVSVANLSSLDDLADGCSIVKTAADGEAEHAPKKDGRRRQTTPQSLKTPFDPESKDDLKRFTRYLRVLDAVSAGIKPNEYGKALFTRADGGARPKGRRRPLGADPDDGDEVGSAKLRAIDCAKKALRQARRIASIDYRQLCRMHLLRYPMSRIYLRSRRAHVLESFRATPIPLFEE